MLQLQPHSFDPQVGEEFVILGGGCIAERLGHPALGSRELALAHADQE